MPSLGHKMGSIRTQTRPPPQPLHRPLTPNGPSAQIPKIGRKTPPFASISGPVGPVCQSINHLQPHSPTRYPTGLY